MLTVRLILALSVIVFAQADMNSAALGRYDIRDCGIFRPTDLNKNGQCSRGYRR
jgi:hypothetical protein